MHFENNTNGVILGVTVVKQDYLSYIEINTKDIAN